MPESPALAMARHNYRMAQTGVRLAHQRVAEANESLDVHLEHLARKRAAVEAFGVDPDAAAL